MSSAKVQDILAFVFLFFVFFLMASGVLVQKIGEYTAGLVLLIAESCRQSPCSVFAVLGCLYTASVNVGVAPPIKRLFLSFAAPVFVEFET